MSILDGEDCWDIVNGTEVEPARLAVVTDVDGVQEKKPQVDIGLAEIKDFRKRSKKAASLITQTIDDTIAVLVFLKTHTYRDDLTPLSEDRVYRRSKGFRWLSHNLYKIHNNGTKLSLVSLLEERHDLVKTIHRDVRHFGVRRIMDRLKQNHWWKGMDTTVNQVVTACMPCARTKARFRVSRKESQPLHLQGLMIGWGIDFVGPLPKTAKGNIFVLVCIEHMTKWVEFIALPSKSSAHLARAFLENILSRFGVLGVVLTNQGTEFQGECLTLLKKQKISHRIASK